MSPLLTFLRYSTFNYSVEACRWTLRQGWLKVIYLRQRRGYMLLPVYICLLARLLKNSCMDLDEMLLVDRRRDMDKLINFWARSGLYPDAGTKLLSPIQLQRYMQRGVGLTWASKPSKHLCRRYMRSTEFPYSCKWYHLIHRIRAPIRPPRATIALRAIVARRQTGRQRQTTKCVLPLTYVDLFRSLRTALTLIKTMQPRGANVICVRLRKRSLSLHDDPEQYRTATKLLLQTECFLPPDARRTFQK